MRKIRNMEAYDVSAVTQLEKELFSDSWSEQAILETHAQRQAQIYIAEETDIMGYAILYYVLDEGEIARIGVSPSHRRKGVGRSLMDAICEDARGRGVTRLLLDVREGNASARQFYQSYGFVEDGVRQNFYQNPSEHAVLMSLPI